MVFWGRGGKTDGDYLKYRCPNGRCPWVAGSGKTDSKCPWGHPSVLPRTVSKYGYVLQLPIKQNPRRSYRRHPPVPRETKKWKTYTGCAPASAVRSSE